LKHWTEINTYIHQIRAHLPIPFYSSVDIRESKEKFAPVDHNMFPAGFNNLCRVDINELAALVKSTVEKYVSDAKVIGIFPESHTKNLYYLDHLATLKQIFVDAGFRVYFLSFDLALFDAANDQQRTRIDLTSQNGSLIEIYKGKIVDGGICCMPEKIDLAICNNDQSNPLPLNWRELKTPLVPTPLIGWFQRQKTNHFKHYRNVVLDFCHHFNINPDLLSARYKEVANVDFETKDGIEKIALAVDELNEEIKKFSLIEDKNFNIFIKASQGTYGMGIMVAKSGEEVLSMNRKTRNKMDVGKNNIKFTTVLLQEGVETILKYDDMPAEITIYLVDGHSIGGFMRVNGEKDSLGNLNAKGMVFKKLCMSDIKKDVKDYTEKEAVYSVIARLATIASAYEIKEVL